MRLRLRVGASESFFICSRRLNSLEACIAISTLMSHWGCRRGIGMGLRLVIDSKNQKVGAPTQALRSLERRAVWFWHDIFHTKDSLSCN